MLLASDIAYFESCAAITVFVKPFGNRESEYVPLYWTTVGSLMPAMLCVESGFGEISGPLEFHE
ncbi:hypothetical protein [Streptomyces acidiscabies]|uniref:hypothetical protein n=1 Tax=Streptomyces acidiscabies TaxID=42234 RepID=UPI0038F7620A